MVNKIEGCVITVPAHFTNIEREATLFAAEMVLKVLQLLNEPSATAISNGHDNGIETSFILVFDYSGGTLDVSIVHKQNDKYDVVGYAGDQILGVRDIDNAILDYSIGQFQTMYGIEHNNAKKRAILLEKCEKAKIVLSDVKRNQSEIFDWNENDSIFLTKNKLEEICQSFFVRSIEILEKFLKKVKREKNEIDVIVMTGGSSRIPLIQKMVTDFFGRQPFCHDPEAAIAKGAALVAFDYFQKYANFNLIDQVRYPIGISVENTEIKDGSFLFSVIIEAGTKTPCSATKQFVTTIDNQIAMSVSIAEGESKYFDGNTLIDSFNLENLPPGKAVEVEIDVTIEINKSSLRFVTATETPKKETKSKEMRREGNYYIENEKVQIKGTFLSLLK